MCELELFLKCVFWVAFFVINARLFFSSKYKYWERRCVPFKKPQFPFGSIGNPFRVKEKPGYILTRLYREMKKLGWKHGGFYVLTTPVYMVIDLENVKSVLVKDFEYFDDRGIYHNEKADPLTGNLLKLNGSKWKALRTKLNAAFTSSKMKQLFHVISTTTAVLVQEVERQTQISKSLDIESLISSYALTNLDIFTFGVSSNFNNETLLKMVKLSRWKLLSIYVASLFPSFAKAINWRIYRKSESDEFINFVSKVRRNNGNKSFMQFLTDLNYGEGKTLTIEEIAAQCYVLFIAGFDTSVSVIIFALYELAKNQNIQERVRDEIKSVTMFNEVSYEAVASLKFLEQIIHETMRKYPAAFYLTRKCTKDYKVPNENVVIEKGTAVVIPVYGIHYDEEYYPNPEIFDPERFNDENRNLRYNYAYLPFGEGPRTCIGKRLGILQVKLGLYRLLKNFRFTINEKTEEPLRIAMDAIVLKPKNKIWLNVDKI